MAAAAGRTGQGGRGLPRRAPPAPVPQRGSRWQAVGRPGGWARCLRTASGSAGPRWCKATDGALLLCHVWSWRGARRASGKRSVDGHETRWADVRREPAARVSCNVHAWYLNRLVYNRLTIKKQEQLLIEIVIMIKAFTFNLSHSSFHFFHRDNRFEFVKRIF